MALKIEEPEQVTFEEASKRGVGGLLDAGSRHPISVRTKEGGVVLVPFELANRVMELLDQRDSVYDLVIAVARQSTDTGDRHSLDDVIEELGYSDAEIDAAD